MAAASKKQTRPSTKPVPIRFSEEMLQEVENVAKLFDISRQDVVRLSVAAGLVSLKRLGWDGLVAAIASGFPEIAPNQLEEQDQTDEAAAPSPVRRPHELRSGSPVSARIRRR